MSDKKEGLHLVVDNAQDFPNEVGPEVKDAVTLYNGMRISAEDAAWLPACYFRPENTGYEGNVRIV